MIKMNKKIIVITGVTSGLGRAMVDRFIEEGHVVAGCGRTVAVIEELNKIHASRHCFSVVDVANYENVTLWASRITEKYKKIDILINNAGIINRIAPFWEITPGEYKNILQTNTIGVMNTIHVFLPGMICHNSGIVVNISSGFGRVGGSNMAPYCASKWAIEGVTEAISKEIPPGIGIVTLNPGVINTNMLQICWPEGAANFPTAKEWSLKAVSFILKITPSDNGQPLILN